MSEFVFSVYVSELKKAWKDTVSNEDLIGLLFDSIVMPLTLKDKNGEYLTVKKETASRLMNRHDNVSPRISKEAANPKVTDSISAYFQNSVIVHLMPGDEAELLHGMMLIIQNDASISPELKEKFSRQVEEKTVAEFLANAFLYVIKRMNKIPKKPVNALVDNEDLEHKSYKRKPLSIVTPPVMIAKEETPYVAALMEAYGEAEDIDGFNADNLDLFPKHKNHFIKQREYYHLAETIRRGTRDMYSESDPDQFEVLKNETFEGVIEIWEDYYSNGLSRLRRVMAQATVIRVDKCWLSRDTDWIGNPQKKGVCHFLVNDKRLEGWVKDDEN